MIQTTSSVCDRNDYRIIRRNGAVVAFNPAKMAASMRKMYLGVSALPAVNSSPCLSVTGDDASGAGSSQGAAEGIGGDDDGDGDGDGDGPRRRTRKPKSTTSRIARRPSQLSTRSRAPRRHIPDTPDISQPHRRSLITLAILTIALLAAAVGFAYAGYPWLASEAMAMAGGLPLLAGRLVKPK